MTIRPVCPADQPEWLRMRKLLFVDWTEQQLAAELADYWNNSTIAGLRSAVFVAEREDGRLGGFVEVSLRPVVDCCRGSPGAYVDLLFVEADQRRRGVARALVRAAENWAAEHGCRQIASDCDRDNLASLAAHLRMGYAPADDLLYFRKSLPAGSEAPACGCPDWSAGDWLAICADPLPVAAAIQFVSDPAAGGIGVFLGTSRSESNADGQPLAALEYEAYAEMARRQFADLARRARARWPVVRLAILHRIGRVELARPSVLIAVSTPHRADAFAACRVLIDALKAEAAIWKKEIWVGGGGTWVGVE